MKSWLRKFGQSFVPAPLRHQLSQLRARLWRPVLWGNLRSTEPFSRDFGYCRGKVIDRFYLEDYLRRGSESIRGRVLEIGDDRYTRQFGGEGVTHTDVFHAVEGNPLATIVGDLGQPEALPADVYDAIICTQTLQYIYDSRVAIGNLHRALKPGGTLLLTVPGIAKVPAEDMRDWGDYWRFTRLSVRKLLEERFGPGQVVVAGFGNLLTAVAFLEGLAAEDLRARELARTDPEYDVVICATARKA